MSEHLIPAFKYHDETLDKNAQEKYVLSIQFMLDGFSFLFLDAERKKFVGLESYSFKNLESAIKYCKLFDRFCEENKWIEGPFKDVLIIYESNKSTFIPEPLFDETEKTLFLNFNHEVSSYEQVLSNYLRNVEAYQVFAMPDCLKYRMDKVFRRKSILHHSVPLIESIIINYKNQPLDRTVFLHAHSNYIDIVAFDKKGLRFFNTFYTPAEEDVIYYLLFVMEQLGLNPEEAELVIMGNIKKFSKRYELLYTYVRNIRFEERTQAFKYSYVFDNLPAQFHYALFNSHILQM